MKECDKSFESADDWHTHSKRHRYEKGYICLVDNCTEFFSINKDILLKVQFHLYLNHNVEPGCTGSISDGIISHHRECVEEGRAWCTECKQFVDKQDYIKLLEHFEAHLCQGVRTKLSSVRLMETFVAITKDPVERPARG